MARPHLQTLSQLGVLQRTRMNTQFAATRRVHPRFESLILQLVARERMRAGPGQVRLGRAYTPRLLSQALIHWSPSVRQPDLLAQALFQFLQEREPATHASMSWVPSLESFAA